MKIKTILIFYTSNVEVYYSLVTIITTYIQLYWKYFVVKGIFHYSIMLNNIYLIDCYQKHIIPEIWDELVNEMEKKSSTTEIASYTLI